MSEDSKNDQQEPTEDFATLLDAYHEGMNEDIQVGDRIKGEIIAINNDTVFINTGTKMDGVVEKTELLNADGTFPFQKGEMLELFVVAFSGNEIRLSKALSGVGGTHILRDAFENAIPIQGKVKDKIKGGFQVEIMQRRAFCPISQMDIKYIEDSDPYLSQSFQFLITQFEENGRNIVVSRRDLLAQEQEKNKKELLAKIQVGDEIQGRVTKLMPYGAFMEIFPGIEGMVHLSELSWSRTQKAEELLRINDQVKAKIIAIEKKADGKEAKISLSIKQITGDPWGNVQDQFHEGDLVQGKVTRCTKFGAFVEIAPGIEGLVHISEMSYRKRINRPEEVVSEGQIIQVMVKELDLKNRRISLSIKDAEGDPWGTLDEKYKVGQIVNGTFEKKESFGYFISLEPGITGLLPKSKAKEGGPAAALLDKAKTGDSIPVVLDEIRTQERRITLSLSGVEGNEDESDWRGYMGQASSKKSFGSLGDKLQAAAQKSNLKR
jgi:small subunit ribosomal protein S1